MMRYLLLSIVLLILTVIAICILFLFRGTGIQQDDTNINILFDPNVSGIEMSSNTLSPLVTSHNLRKHTGLGKDFDVYLNMLDNTSVQLKHIWQAWVLSQKNKHITLEHIPLFPDKQITFVPNQELVGKHDEKLLLQKNRVTNVVCKSQYAYNIFKTFKTIHNCDWNVRFANFPPVLTTQYFDQPKDRNVFFHPAGNSWMKNTSAVVNTWTRHPEWPTLIVSCKKPLCFNTHHLALKKTVAAKNIIFSNFLSSLEFDRIKKHAGYVILPSACEGFGHGIYEALENGNLLISADIPPINESLKHNVNCLLVKPSVSVPLGTQNSNLIYVHQLSKQIGASGSACFTISENDVEHVVEQALQMNDKQYKELRINAVTTLLHKVKEGTDRLHKVFGQLGFNLKK